MRAATFAALLSLTTAQAAQALTIRDVIELTRAGVTEDVLLALIDVDGGVYATDTATLKSLKAAGVSERVMVALVRSGRERPAEPPAAPPVAPVVDETPAPAPQVVVIEHHDQPVQQVAVPVYVPVYTTYPRVHRTVDRTGVIPDRTVGIQESTFVPIGSVPAAATPRPEPAAAPVYWGFGGKLRPDAWGQAQEQQRLEQERKKAEAEDTAKPRRRQ